MTRRNRPGRNERHRRLLELIPRLAPGVLVHAHDIFLPAEYPARLVHGQRRFWTAPFRVTTANCCLMNFTIGSLSQAVWTST
jgi:hypothetical protein